MIATLLVASVPLHHSALQAIHRDLRFPAVSVRKNGQKFIFSITDENVSGAEVPLEHLRKLEQDAFADHMAEAVIQRPEPVNVNHHQGETAAGALGASHFPAQHFVERSAIEETSQLINPGEQFRA